MIKDHIRSEQNATV